MDDQDLKKIAELISSHKEDKSVLGINVPLSLMTIILLFVISNTVVIFNWKSSLEQGINEAKANKWRISDQWEMAYRLRNDNPGLKVPDPYDVRETVNRRIGP